MSPSDLVYPLRLPLLRDLADSPLRLPKRPESREDRCCRGGVPWFHKSWNQWLHLQFAGRYDAEPWVCWKKSIQSNEKH